MMTMSRRPPRPRYMAETVGARRLSAPDYASPMAATEELFAVEAPARTTCRDLVPVAPGTCPACGAALHLGSSVQPALFVGLGYGEAHETRERSCSCGWRGVGAGDFASLNPRRL